MLLGEGWRQGCKDDINNFKQTRNKRGQNALTSGSKACSSVWVKGGGLKMQTSEQNVWERLRSVITSCRKILSGRDQKYLLLAITGPILQLWLAFSSNAQLLFFIHFPTPWKKTKCLMYQNVQLQTKQQLPVVWITWKYPNGLKFSIRAVVAFLVVWFRLPWWSCTSSWRGGRGRKRGTLYGSGGDTNCNFFF